MSRITKAVILAAGYGTRVLPMSKAIPKEMLPIWDKPAIQYVVEELAASGITDIIFVLSRGKTAIMEHFDRAPLLEQLLRSRKTAFYDEICDGIERVSTLANFSCVYQTEMNGTVGALNAARPLIHNEPFLVVFPDDVIMGEVPAAKQVLDVFDEFCGANVPGGAGVTAMQAFPGEEILKYGSLGIGGKVKTWRDDSNAADGVARGNAALGDSNTHGITEGFAAPITGMREKPPTLADALSEYAIIGRIALTYDIFPLLDGVKPGASGELYITDAMVKLSTMYGVAYTGERFDTGSKLGLYKANMYVGGLNANA
ncbi:UTP--glucose-1-phosphate uridylyltransferase [Clostridia bacterium]|nr:UTP--glucose-1-phosphate uridylyltransferase [Clostridia bacterium]